MIRPTNVLRRIAVVAFAVAMSCSSQPCDAHPVIRRWSYEATVLSIENQDDYFVDLQRGDPVSGTIGYDLTAYDLFGGWYDHAYDFPIVTAAVENPRTGGVSDYRSPYALGVGVWDEEPDWNGDDVLYLLQQVETPTNWPHTTIHILATVVLQSTEAFTGSALPTELHLDNWRLATLSIFYDGDNLFEAEIHTLTPIDVPLLPGDFNGDGLVDRRDLGVWDYVYGSEDANLAADANLDGNIDGNDFLAWQRGLGGSTTAGTAAGVAASAPGAAVPEPTTAGLALAACGAVIACTRRSRYSPPIKPRPVVAPRPS
jgi:hypothetical protein